MEHIYCISGFGADEQMFSKLTFNGYEVHHLKWLIPDKNESLVSYAHRMADQLLHSNVILVGLSFGGMMSIEISKLIPVKAVILISSIKSFHEMPNWMKFAGRLNLHKIIPLRSGKLTYHFQNNNLGVETPEEIKIAQAYRKNVNQQYTDWAIDIILKWKNEWQPPRLFHIHGRADRIFPIKKIKNCMSIQTGTHFMIMNRSREVNAAIQKVLAQLSLK